MSYTSEHYDWAHTAEESDTLPRAWEETLGEDVIDAIDKFLRRRDLRLVADWNGLVVAQESESEQ